MDKDDWKLTEARIKKQVERKKENIIMKTITKISTILLSTTLLFGCASNTDDSIPVVGVAQIVSHTSLNTIRDSFSAQMEELGYIDGENIEINYADASNQQRKRGLFSLAVHKEDREYFKEKLRTLDMGLEDRLKTPIGLLSGGQRQAVALMMAVLNPPKILLLDEHTAALDPKSAKKILRITNELIEKEHITALMITHNINDALVNGNRLFIMNDGTLIQDFETERKKQLKPADILNYYEV